MMTAEEHLLIFEGASAGQYPQRSCPNEQRAKISKCSQPEGLRR
jgi:hypothetical protein